MKYRNLILFLIFATATAQAAPKKEVVIEVKPNVRRVVGGVSEFNREVMINAHASPTEPDWNDQRDKVDYFLNELNAHFGRETGFITGTLRKVNEDPERPGYADPTHLSELATKAREQYATNMVWKKYEPILSEIIVCAQLHPFWPDGRHGNDEGNSNWSISTTDTKEEPLGTASGEFMGRYIKEFFGNDGPPRPKYVEVINEPLYDLTSEGNTDPKKVFHYHNAVADQIRKYNDDVLIGGYTMAFPLFEYDDFGRWDERFKSFVDIAGEKMDFYSIHFYDFPGIQRGQVRLRKGSNIEATFDMIDHYSELKLGHRKPYLISEYGSQLNDWYNQPWTPFRDWLCIKAANSMLMQFMERPDQIHKAVFFTPPKAEWGRKTDNVPYYWRLLRREGEDKGRNKGDWVWSEQIKFFELWSDVQGTRVLAGADNVDVQTDAYVSGKTMYIILNNLTEKKRDIKIRIDEQKGNQIKGVKIKNCYLKSDEPIIETDKGLGIPRNIELRPEATMIFELTYKKPLKMQADGVEKKYFADTYLQPIENGDPVTFNINGVETTAKGQANLRLGIGRDHGKKPFPKEVTVNGTAVEVPENFRGDDEQEDRKRFFGLLEIPVPYELIQPTNTVTATFSSSNGHVSSAALRITNFVRPE